MNEILIVTERVKNTIALGESHFREFKSALEGRPDAKKARNVTKICQDIAEALVSFANADGGELIIGVEDDGSITGVPHDKLDIETLINAPKSHIYKEQHLPMTYCQLIEIDDKKILFFSVNKGDGKIYQLPDGRCVRRKDRETIPIDLNSIIIERAEQRSREYDRDFIDGATVADLDIDLLQELSILYLPGISIEKYLQQIGVAEYTSSGMKLRRAAIILFAKKIDNWMPRSEIRIIKVNGTELLSGSNYNVLVDERYSGNAFKLLTSGWDFIRPFLIGKTEFGADATFQSKYVYPEIACREALVNAVAHRDYTATNSIDFILYDDKLTVKSPGMLLSTIKIEDLLTFRNVHESRNVYVARVLRENKYMREMGEGIKRIYDILNDSDVGVPTIESKEGCFYLTIENKSIYSQKELEWLSLFDSYKLNKQQKRIVALGLHDREISPEDIYQALNTRDRNTYDTVVTSLRVISILNEIRSAAVATQLAKKKEIQKQKIGRFRITSPGRQHILSDGKVPNAIFAFNLPQNVTKEELTESFKKYGEIIDIRQPLNHFNGKPHNYCFVHFESDKTASELIRRKKILIKDSEVDISEYVKKNSQPKRK